MTQKLSHLLRSFLIAMLSLGIPQWARAEDSAFTGPGLFGGINWAGMIGGPSHLDLASLVISVIEYVLTFVALAAVIVIIVAGIRLIVSQGEEEPKNTAKKAIIYAIIGLIVVILSRIIVAIVLSIFFH